MNRITPAILHRCYTGNIPRLPYFAILPPTRHLPHPGGRKPVGPATGLRDLSDPEESPNLTSKDDAAVGWGSCIANGLADCSACHSFPEFLEKGNAAGSNPAVGDPFEGTPSPQSARTSIVNINISHYLAGGQSFGPFMIRNLTPDSSGRPEDFTEKELITVMGTGEDIHWAKFPADPICAPDAPTLQVMPGPPTTT